MYSANGAPAPPRASDGLEFYSDDTSQYASQHYSSDPHHGGDPSGSGWGGAMAGHTGAVPHHEDDPDWLDEPPLLEELGINVEHIWTKTTHVLLPTRIHAHSMDDADLAGPLCYCLLLGFSLLLAGKVHFGAIYGFAIVGCLSLHLLLQLMSPEPFDLHRVVSILGYCLLPIVALSLLGVLLHLQGAVGSACAVFAVLWCTLAATRFFEMVFRMRTQRYLVAYPLLLLYSCFALITIF